MTNGVAHIIGAGLAGLASAVHLCGAGRRVVVHELSQRAGGRCHSFLDRQSGQMVDNGTHLALSGNRELADYLARVGAGERMVAAGGQGFPFADVRNGKRWCLNPGNGMWPGWLFSRHRSVPGASPWAWLRGGWALYRGGDKTVFACVGHQQPLYERVWQPLSLAVLNCRGEEASAALLWSVIAKTFLQGGSACRPMIAKQNLHHALVDPALAYISDHGGEVRYGERLREVSLVNGRCDGLRFSSHDDTAVRDVPLGPRDRVVMALPPRAAQDILPGMFEQTHIDLFKTRTIANVHFFARSQTMPLANTAPVLMGVINGLGHWLVMRDGVVSVTLSDAGEMKDSPDVVAARLWAEICRVWPEHFGGMESVPPFRMVREKSATFSQTPAAAANRPKTKTQWPNVFLAGDWTDTGLPATMEGAVLSGRLAAEMAKRTDGI